jgi:hypothetical protein
MVRAQHIVLYIVIGTPVLKLKIVIILAYLASLWMFSYVCSSGSKVLSGFCVLDGRFRYVRRPYN